LKSSHNTKKIIFLAFLLSLLFHFSGLVYVTLHSNDEKIRLHPEKQTTPELQKQINNQQHNEWVEAKARVGNFGTPVFFQDEFEPEQSEIQSSFAPSFAESSGGHSKATDDKQEVIENKPEENLEEEKQQETITQKESTPTTPAPQQTSFTTQDSQPKPIQPTKQAPARPRPSHPRTVSQTPKPLSAPKPPLTLAQLSQGFLNHVKHEGNHAVHMLGKKSGRPTDEQIKYERYLQKLSWCLQNSFNIHNDRFPRSANNDDSVQVLLALNKDGSLKDCRVSKTSGNRDLDYFTLFIFKDASTSFPPVPEYLPHDPFAINYIIMVGASEDGCLKLYRQ
jgi:outer membrane biosynthesis protein TonB